MEALELPVRSDIKSYTFTITLEDRNYSFAFKFNERRNLWTMNLGDANGLPLMLGINMQQGFNLIGNITGDNFPPGNFTLVDETGHNEEADGLTFGNLVKLVYVTE